MSSKRTQTPLVSIHMVFKNAEAFIDAALNSVFSQTFQDFEVILVDDNSTDNTKAKLALFHDPRMRYFKNLGSGLGAARQLALLNSFGEWVAVFDADDISLPNRLELSLGLARKGNVVVSGQMDEISEDGLSLGKHRFFPTNENKIRACLGTGYSLCHGASLYEAHSAREVGGYSSGFQQIGEDEDLFIRLASKGQIANLDVALIQRRIHRQSVCTNFQKTHWVLPISLFTDSQLIDSAYFARLGKAALRGGRPKDAAKFYWESLAACPLKMNAWFGFLKSLVAGGGFEPPTFGL